MELSADFDEYDTGEFHEKCQNFKIYISSGRVLYVTTYRCFCASVVGVHEQFLPGSTVVPSLRFGREAKYSSRYPFLLHKGYGKPIGDVAGDESVILYLFIKGSKSAWLAVRI